MIPLKREDIKKVRPKFRKMVLKAWEIGWEVPESVTLLSDLPLTNSEINRGVEISNQCRLDR